MHRRVVFWKLTALLLLSFILLTHFPINSSNKKDDKVTPITLAKSAFANDVYPEFTCPCCGQVLNKENPCCGAMTKMIDFIDEKVEAGLSEEEVILATTKQFGLDRLTKSEKREEIKKLLAEKAPPDAPIIKFEEDSQNLGEISQLKGEVSVDFSFRNEGKTDLLIEKLSSSCGCTSASIVYQEQEGPKFTMEGHGKKNPKNWKVSIAPDDTAILRVYYDPTIHKDLTGPVTRYVSIFSNDPVEFEKKITITLDQVP